MGSRRFATVLALLAIVPTLCGRATAQTINGCTPALTSLAPCLNYTIGNSPAPSPSCCSQLTGVVRSSPQCLCAVVNGPIPNIGININRTLALQLPGACNIQAPPLTQCNAAANGPTASTPISPPVTSPAGSPADETPGAATTPSASDVPSGAGGGSKTVPSTGAGSSHGNVAGTPVNFALFAVFFVSSASILSNIRNLIALGI